MRLPHVRFPVKETLVALLVIVSPGKAADDSPRARLAALEAAQKAEAARYRQELQAARSSAEAQRLAVDRHLAELEKNVAGARRLAPDGPAAASALKFVIKTNCAGPGPATAEALRMMLDHRRFADKGQGELLGHMALTLFQYPDAERYLRRVLDENPDHEDRGAACYWLARYYRQQERIARRLRAKPDGLKDFEKYTAAMPIAKFVETANPEDLERRCEALLEQAAKEFGDVSLDGDTRPMRGSAAAELFAMRHLNVGQPAPEIEGTDTDGKAFKSLLSAVPPER